MKFSSLSMTALSLLLVSGCSTAPVVLKSSIPSNLKQPCPPLESVSPKTLGELLEIAVQDANQYRECMERHNALVEVFK